MHSRKLAAHDGALGQGREVDHQIHHLRAVVRRRLAHDAGAHAMCDLPLQGVDRVLLGLVFDGVFWLECEGRRLRLLGLIRPVLGEQPWNSIEFP